MAPLPAPFLLSSFCSSGWEGGAHSPPGGVSLGFLILLPLPLSSGWSMSPKQWSGWSCFLSNPTHHHFLSDGFCKTQKLPTNTFGFIWDIFWSLFRIPPYLINLARLLPQIQILNKKVLPIAQSSHQRFSFERDSYGSSSVRFASLKSA